MSGRNNRKIFMLAVSVAAIVTGIYMSFIHEPYWEKASEDAPEETEAMNENTLQGEEGSEQEVEMNDHDYSERELPIEENESDGEFYNNGKADVYVYFSNTGMLDASEIPLEAQAVLVSEVQTFLERRGYGDVSELYIDDDSFTEQDGVISFECFMDGYTEKLQIEYDAEAAVLNYYIIDVDGGGTYAE